MNAAGAIRQVEHELKADFDAMRRDLKTDIGVLRVELRKQHNALIKWLAGIAIVQTASIIFGTVGLMRLLG